MCILCHRCKIKKTISTEISSNFFLRDRIHLKKEERKKEKERGRVLLFPSPFHVKVLVAQSCPTLCNPTDNSLPGSSAKGFSRQEYWSGSHTLLQGIFPTQGLNPGLPHCRQILYHLSYREDTLFTIYPSKSL